MLPAPPEKLSATHVAMAYLLVLTVLACDTLLPVGFAITSLYLVPLGFLTLWSSPKQSSPVLLLAAVCVSLIGVGFLLSPPGPVEVAVANRLFAITIIGITTLLSVLRKRTEDDMKVLRGLLPICSYCKKIRDNEGYWQQVERYIAARSEAGFTHGMCPDCGSTHFPDITAEPSTKASMRKPLGFFSRQEC